MSRSTYYRFCGEFPSRLTISGIVFTFHVRFVSPWWQLVARKQAEPPVEVLLALSAHGRNGLARVLYETGFTVPARGGPEARLMKILVKHNFAKSSFEKD